MNLSPPNVRTIPVELAELAAAGYDGIFFAKEGGRIACGNCRKTARAREMEIIDIRRLEGQSDPADMACVIAVRCTGCGHRGALVLTYGAQASSEDADVLAALDDHAWREHAQP